MKCKFDIVISGGGIPALLLAIHAAAKGFVIAIAEPYPPEEVLPPPCGRTAAIMQEGMGLIKTLSIWNNLQNSISPLKILRIVDGGVSKSFEATETGHEEYGYNIPLPLLRKELWALAQQTNKITLFPHIKITDYKKNTASIDIKLSNNTNLAASLLIAADGRNSTIREHEQIKIISKDYQQSALTCLLKHSKPHNETSTEFHREGGPFTLVPLPQQHSSLVWMLPNEDAEKLQKLRKPDIENYIQAQTENALGTIELISGTSFWPIVTLHTNTLIAKRIALMAEAAHVVPPTGAQGLNISLADVIALLQILGETQKAGGDIGSQATLLKYERMRLPDIKARVICTQGLNQMVKTKNGFLQNIRRTGLAATHDIPLLRKLAMQAGLRSK